MAQPGKQALAQSEARGQGLQPAVNLGQSAQASNFQAVSRANHSLQTQTQTGTPPVTQVQVVEQTDPPRSWLDTTTKVVLISIVPVVIVGVIMALITILRRGHHKL